jgi:cell division protein ZapE
MREVHRELALLQGTVDPLDALARQMARKYRLLCFDEFHVADITDAMILHRLLDALFAQGVGFVTTSNFHPDDAVPERIAPRPHPAGNRVAQ